jgi:hypothetical protein
VLLAHTLAAGSMLHVPHDTFVSYIATHPAEYNTVVVPWVEWGPGNSHLNGAPNMLLDRYSRQTTWHVCSHRAPNDPKPWGEKTLRIKDDHPQRVARILSKQDLHLPGPVNVKAREGSDHFNITTGQPSHSSTQHATTCGNPICYYGHTIPG